jgi:hypothetical protein
VKAHWTYELPVTGSFAENLDDYEALTADGVHAGIVTGVVERGSDLYVLVDAGPLPPLLHRRLAIRWQDIAEIDHDALTVTVGVERASLADVALTLDPARARHDARAEAVRVAGLPAGTARPVVPGSAGPIAGLLEVAVLVAAALSPFTLLVVVALESARGLAGWEYAAFAIPVLFAALALALAGYHLYREPHAGRRALGRSGGAPAGARPAPSSVRRRRGAAVLAGFALGGAAVYLATQLVVTLALGEALPVLGWVGFAVVVGVVAVAASGLAVFLVGAARQAGVETVGRPTRLRQGGPTRRVLVVADAACPAPALCDALVSRAGGAPLDVFVAAPALVSPVRYLDSDLDGARAAARRRLDETLTALAAGGISAQGTIASESPLEAIGDALAVFPADEIVVATAGVEPGNWLELDVVERARAHGLPVSSLVLEAPAPPG